MVFEPTTDIRPAYKDAFLKTLFNEPILDDTDNCADKLVFPPFNGSLQFVSEYTEEEWTKLLSCILQGAIIIYPNELNRIYWSFVRQLDCPVDICDLVLNCIQTNPEIQQEIARYSNSSSITEVTPEQQVILDTDLFDNPVTCNNDQIFGMTTQLASFLNATSEDILEIFVTAFAVPGRLGDIIEAIPVVETLPFDDILQFLEKLATQVNDAYQAAYDTQIAEDIACDLFCIAQSNCELTLEQARDYFQGRFTNAVSNTDFFTIVNDIIANNWLGEQSIWVMHWLILDTIIFGGEILGIDVNRIVTTIATFYNDPNPDWSLLCNCTTIINVPFDSISTPEYDLTAFISGSAVEIVAPVLQSNEDGNPIPSCKTAFVETGGGAFGGLQVIVRVELAQELDVTEVDFDIWYQRDTAGEALSRLVRLRDVNLNELDVVSAGGAGIPQQSWFTFQTNANALGVKFVDCRISVVDLLPGPTPSNQFGFIDNIRIVGTP